MATRCGTAPGITLGLARLAIVAPHLPSRTIANETATVHGVVNGEIYNHRELRRGLEARGHRVLDRPRHRGDPPPL